MSSYHGQTSKPRTKVKPMLKKLTQSEKNSLDLDRPIAEQDVFGSGVGLFEYGTGPRSSHDVVFSTTGRRGYHNRSTSGTSQFSTATTGSGHRAGSFVHPFQQTPRPYTPPLAASYQNSLRESEHSNSPALTEDEDQLRYPLRNPSSNRAPSLTGSAPPIINQPLRIQTKPSTSRLALATSNISLQSPNSLNPPDVSSPVETMSPSSLRTSIDKGFRIRSRSEVDTRVRQETIQEARRKFQEREQLKEEKAAREEIRQLEKRNLKEAREMERQHRRSSASEATATQSKRSKSDLTRNISEKGDPVFARDYNNLSGQSPPYMAEEVPPATMRKTHKKMATTKKKTHSAWTKLMMWIRTRFIRMGRKREHS
ncbi:hypothetical protein G7Y89_g15113 [Cudoniella acicularis]|uniref:Uncharacterized protein n=1 Tax=Cudoniella acicularis TaxID=354080 RepID=A0A8H4QUP8_9HELO|nr:hypothetical protein G7Y89_g15113 [Cudoniella acicularis]